MEANAVCVSMQTLELDITFHNREANGAKFCYKDSCIAESQHLSVHYSQRILDQNLDNAMPIKTIANFADTKCDHA